MKNHDIQREKNKDILWEKNNYKTINEKLTSFIDKYFKEDSEIINFVGRLLDELRDDEFIDISRGKPEIWISSIILVICRLNFLFDKSVKGSLQGLDTIYDFFGSNKSTVGNKASQIQNEFGIVLDNELYTREEFVDSLNVIQLPNGFVITVKQLKEIEETVGELTDDN